jgi:hypothetical protein
VIDTNGLTAGPGVAAGNRFFFGASMPTIGVELWAAALDGTRPKVEPSAVRIEFLGTTPTLKGTGVSFRVHLDRRTQFASRVTVSTVDGTLTAKKDYVAFTRELTFEDDDVVVIVPLNRADASGTMSLVLSMPVDVTIEQGLATAVIGGRRRAVR